MSDSQDLDHWLEVLAGRKTASLSDTAARLRKILLEQDRQIDENIRANHPSEELALEEFRYRLQRARFTRKSALRRFGLPLGLAAALLLALNLAYFQPWRDHGAAIPTESQVSAPPALDEIDIRLAHPDEAANLLHRELAHAGVQASVSQAGEVYTVDFVIPDERTLTLGVGVIAAGINVGPGHHVIHLSAP